MNEHQLLQWLAKEDCSAFGECCGSTLNSLVLQGKAQIHGSGVGAAVSLTDFGRRQAAQAAN